MQKTYYEADGTCAMSTQVDRDVRQLKRLQAAGVSDENDLSHRIGAPLKSVRKMLKLVGDTK